MDPDEFLSKLSEIKRNEYDLRFLINYICLRPKMFVGNDDLRTIAAFIDGFASSNEAASSELRNFNEWLAVKLKFPPNLAWWGGLEKKYPDAEEARKELPKLFEDFTKERNPR